MSTTRIPRPEFVDSRGGNTLAEALRAHLRLLTDTFNQPIDVSIAASRTGRRACGAEPAVLLSRAGHSAAVDPGERKGRQIAEAQSVDDELELRSAGYG